MRGPLFTKFVFGCFVLAAAVSTSLVTSYSQAQRPADQQKPDKITVNTGEVQLDVVVRDKGGHLRQDLAASDFEVYEDGVRQEITSFGLASAANQQATRAEQQGKIGDQQRPASGAAVTNATPDSSNVRGVSAVALVFDRLTPDGRARATQAALNYLQASANKDELFGVFVTDLSVAVLQPFTDDRQLVKAGIEKAGAHSTSLYTSNNEKTREARDQATLALLKAQTGRASGPMDHGTITQSLLEFLEKMERNEQGNATTRGLLFVASSLRSLPGRKAVIFFSEGMILPPSVMATFSAIIDTANRGNVSFYSVDAAGLRAEGKEAETVREMKSMSEYRIAQLGSTADPNGPMMTGLERNEDLLRLNPDSGLGQLADQTGGFLITDSNDLKARLRKVDEDLHSYYLLSYTSKNQNYDGHFRKIEVKVRRPGLNVQSRKGYFGIKGTFASPVLSYEAPALAALENTPHANSFPFAAGGFSFPERERTGLATVVADVPLSAFTFLADQEKRIYQTDFSIVSLLKDESGQVVDKLSKQYRLSGPLDKLDEMKPTRVLFYRETGLAPGRYTLEAVAYDAPTGRTSVRSGTIEVVSNDEGKLRLSDIVILKRAEPATAADEKQSNPFHVGNVIVSPNLGEPLSRSMKEVPFFFVVYPNAANVGGLKLTIELRQQDRTLARMPGDLPQADASGRIQYLAGLPIDKIPAGSYELRITVADGPATVTRSVYFKIQN